MFPSCSDYYNIPPIWNSALWWQAECEIKTFRIDSPVVSNRTRHSGNKVKFKVCTIAWSWVTSFYEQEDIWSDTVVIYEVHHWRCRNMQVALICITFYIRKSNVNRESDLLRAMRGTPNKFVGSFSTFAVLSESNIELFSSKLSFCG